MSRGECAALVEQLNDAVRQGYTLLTWNGLGFDFDILAEESGQHAACCELARAHVDMMFHFFCLQGYPLGLDTAAKGMGLAGKPEGMDGSLAPLLWQQCEYDKVLAYVRQDVVTTLSLAEEVAARRQIRWQTRGGKANRVPIAQWLPVSSALALPLPDNKWLRKPMTRARFTAWMDQPR
jgi:predicted PolB exonuclease-like 3'-5' exonuclease